MLAASLVAVGYTVNAPRTVDDDCWSAAQARRAIERHAADPERLSAFGGRPDRPVVP